MSEIVVHEVHGPVQSVQSGSVYCNGCCMYSDAEGCEVIGRTEFSCFPDTVFQPVQLGVGDTFSAISHTGRVIPLGKVIAIEESPYPYHVRWFDENGKHYEWFNLVEFKEFEVIHKEKLDV